MNKAFTLIELLVVIAIVSILMAVILPPLRYARAQAAEAECRSNLRQLAVVLRTYTHDHDGLFPGSAYLYHSPGSFDRERWPQHNICCRWHDAGMGLGSALMGKHPELRGSLWPYLGKKKIVLCQVGKRANDEMGCYNYCPPTLTHPGCPHNPDIPVETQYTYAMNVLLGGTSIATALEETGAFDKAIVPGTYRSTTVRRTTQVTRSPSQVFVFGEKNSWAVNTEGRQPLYHEPHWPAPYELSGRYYRDTKPPGDRGTLRLSDLHIWPTYRIRDGALTQDLRFTGDAFATYHRPRRGDLHTGHSNVVMLDGHVEKVTVQDQLRRSRQVPALGQSKLGPGGNLSLAWPLDIPPPGGWDGQ